MEKWKRTEWDEDEDGDVGRQWQTDLRSDAETKKRETETETAELNDSGIFKPLWKSSVLNFFSENDFSTYSEDASKVANFSKENSFWYRSPEFCLHAQK